MSEEPGSASGARVRVVSLVVALSLTAALVLVGRTLNVPVGDWLLSVSDQYYARYGYPAVFIGALLEGTIVVNFYVPGSTIVILGAVASRGGALSIAAVIGIATMGFILAYSFCYMLGWLGWYAALRRLGFEGALRRMHQRMVAAGPRIIPLANIHPNLGALAATSAGILRVPFFKFIMISAPSTLAWTTFWGLLAYWLGREAVRLFNGWLLTPVVLVPLAWFVVGARRQQERPRDVSDNA